MDTITVNVTTGVILAMLTGLAFLAYKHPQAYRPVGLVLLSLVIFIIVFVSVWDVAAQQALVALIPHLKADDFQAAADAVDKSSPARWQVYIGAFALTIYLLFLAGLPSLLGKKPTDDVRDGDKP